MRALQDELVRGQVRAVAAGSGYWRGGLPPPPGGAGGASGRPGRGAGAPPGGGGGGAPAGRTAASISGTAALASVPAVGERDVSPGGDPAAMAALVLHGGERQFALHTSGPQLRRAIRLRATGRSAYRRIVDSETKATSYAW